MKRTRVCGSVPLLNTHSVHIFMTHISLGQCGLQGQEVRMQGLSLIVQLNNG